MAYIGNEPVIGQWRKLDDISGSFNGSLTSFTTQVGGTNVTAGSANQLLVSLGGVLQEPGTDYSVSSSTITFTTAPAASLSFFAVLAGDALNTSVPADGSITTAKLGANLTVDLGLGSAGTPSLTFDADTGLFSGGDNQVNVSTSGVERAEFGASEVVFNDGGADYDFRVEGDTDAVLLFVDASTDRIGVGTSTPSTKVDISANNDSSGENNTLRFTDTDTSTAADQQIGKIEFFSNDVTTPGAGVKAYIGAFAQDTSPDAYLDFATQDGSSVANPVTRMRILSDGRVGIGTTSPGQTLHVNAASGDVTGRFSATSAAGTNSVVGLIAGTSGTAVLQFGDSGSSDIGQIRYENSDDSMVFNVNGSNRVTIDSSGRLLVGTTTEGYAGAENLTVATSGNTGITIRSGTTSNCTLAFSDGTSGNDEFRGYVQYRHTSNELHFGANAAEAAKFNSLGEFFVYDVYNSTSASAANVVVVSSGRMIRSTSSGKYKTNIETLQDSYADAILNVRPVWYRSTCEADNPSYGWWGFIAEEVAEIDPRLVFWKTTEVTYDENGSAVETPCHPEPEGVAYDRFVPHLLNLIKRQGEAIADLQAEVAALKGA